MSYNSPLPEWNKSEPKPNQTKLDEGWKPEEKPPASVWNWFMNTTYKALKELQEKAVAKGEDGKLVADRLVDGAATDAAIGNRTIDQTQTPVNTGLLSALLGGLANMIKKITGKSDWKTEPRTTLENAARLTGDTFKGVVSFDGGGEIVSVKAGNSDHVYIGFYGDTQAPNTRSGYFGYPNAGSTDLSIGNEMENGNIHFVTKGKARLNGNELFHAGNHNSAGDPHAQYVRKTQSVTGDWNDVTTTGFYDGNLLLNACPGGTHGWRYCQVTSHSQDGGARWVHQVMTAFDGTGTYERFSQDIGTQRKWTPWYLVSQHNNLRQYAGSKDEMKLLYKVVDHKRADGTIYAQSILSNPDANGNYQTLSLTYYNNAGTVALETKSWTFMYDSDGLITSKVPNF
ncbi:hypothetical protein FB479_11680 [Brevibacillus sp. AG162]|uniref:pyocin knob domain-containing protein n=1 Tax=Brevibacillus sp. AG162 TaxID=2572910 RepID=UPI00114FD283|nr:pyocin knob domain-containing protein [Brevibacillus sp. AG162]TQK41979.1 hypothetical protein FB479_11680 [Brevibacillus sp. AG162]